jgi:hypothetical protein
VDVKPVRLAKVVVIQQSHSELFALLVDRPEWLALLERLVLNRAPGSLAPPAKDVAAAAAETTVQLGPGGVAVPPALERFLQEPRLVRLLGALADDPNAASDVEFSGLAAAEIAVYFSLTGRVSTRSPAMDPARAATGETTVAIATSEPDFGSRYRVIKQIGRGGTSEVFLAHDIAGNRGVAIKMLLATLADDPLWTARYERESATLARIPPHPNVVAVIDRGLTAERDGKRVPYYVMDWVAGDTLQQRLARTGRMSLAETQRLLGPVFDALTHIHAAGLVHRDLKPSSIGIGADGAPKLLDFGLALEQGADTDQLTRTGTVLGTPSFMSPEQILGEPTDARSDLYSLGAILFVCLTGETPYQGAAATLMYKIAKEPVPSAVGLVPELPLQTDSFFARMMAKNASERYADAAGAKRAFMAIGMG